MWDRGGWGVERGRTEWTCGWWWDGEVGKMLVGGRMERGAGGGARGWRLVGRWWKEEQAEMVADGVCAHGGMGGRVGRWGR